MCVCVCACVRAIASVCICAILHYGIHNIVISIIYEVSWYGANGIYFIVIIRSAVRVAIFAVLSSIYPEWLGAIEKLNRCSRYVVMDQ